MSRSAIFLLLIVGLFICAACNQAPTASNTTNKSSQKLHDLFKEDWEWQLKEFPEAATNTGDHRYDDRLTDHSFVEGWALYAESLGPEIGFYTDPYSKFGQLTYEMWRACRLVVDTGMHALGWSREQAIDFMKANTAKTENDIVVEVDRYIVWPGQALAYKLGELKIKELRAKAKQALGDKFDLRKFHNAVLDDGPLPLELMEKRVNEWIAEQRK